MIKKYISKAAKQVTIRTSTMGELFQFMWHEKIWWMVPCVALLLLISVLILFSQSSPIAPFLYTIF